MRVIPILFSMPMMCALIDGKKTQTRRLVKQKYLDKFQIFKSDATGDAMISWRGKLPCPYGEKGDLLWVRETFTEGTDGTDCGAYKWPIYATEYRDCIAAYKAFKPWKPSMFMPRKYSRMTLEIISIRVLPLQQINEDDAVAEGMTSDGDGSAVISYSTLWDAINGGGSWDKNPWVWAITFRVHKKNVDDLRKEMGCFPVDTGRLKNDLINY